MAVGQDLAAFIEAAAARPFRWGGAGPDCILMLCDWVLAVRGVDPGAPFRNRYATALGARRLIRRAGGLVALLDAGFAAVGLARGASPAEGDVAVVRGLTASGEDLCGAIRFAGRWAGLKSGGGVIVADAAPVAVWRV